MRAKHKNDQLALSEVIEQQAQRLKEAREFIDTVRAAMSSMEKATRSKLMSVPQGGNAKPPASKRTRSQATSSSSSSPLAKKSKFGCIPEGEVWVAVQENKDDNKVLDVVKVQQRPEVNGVRQMGRLRHVKLKHEATIFVPAIAKDMVYFNEVLNTSYDCMYYLDSFNTNPLSNTVGYFIPAKIVKHEINDGQRCFKVKLPRSGETTMIAVDELIDPLTEEKAYKLVQ